MLPRPVSFPRLNALFRPASIPSPIRLFHTTAILQQTHYEVLGLEPNASLAAIKKQFYTLSKLHHPDRNRTSSTSSDPPPSSEKFIAINTAYATLRNPTKRAAYDRTLPSFPNTAPSGSYSSSTGPYGARPASGLSKRRGVFRGPPPSFYRARGQSQPGFNPASQGPTGQTGAGAGGYGGFSPGQMPYRGSDNDVPHFDREGHFRRQEVVEEHVRKRRKRLEEEAEFEREKGDGEVMLKLVVVGSVVGIAWFMTSLGQRADVRREK